MSAALPDDDELRRRVLELGRREAAGAPSLSHVLRDGGGPRRETHATLGWRLAVWPVLAVAVVFLAVAVPRRWLARPGAGAQVTPAVVPSAVELADDWRVPSDRLLADLGDDAGENDVGRLSRDIERLLKR